MVSCSSSPFGKRTSTYPADERGLIRILGAVAAVSRVAGSRTLCVAQGPTRTRAMPVEPQQEERSCDTAPASSVSRAMSVLTSRSEFRARVIRDDNALCFGGLGCNRGLFDRWRVQRIGAEVWHGGRRCFGRGGRGGCSGEAQHFGRRSRGRRLRGDRGRGARGWFGRRQH